MTQFARSVSCETSRSFGDFVTPLFVIYEYAHIPFDYGRPANVKRDISSVQYPEKARHDLGHTFVLRPDIGCSLADLLHDPSEMPN